MHACVSLEGHTTAQHSTTHSTAAMPTCWQQQPLSCQRHVPTLQGLRLSHVVCLLAFLPCCFRASTPPCSPTVRCRTAGTRLAASCLPHSSLLAWAVPMASHALPGPGCAARGVEMARPAAPWVASLVAAESDDTVTWWSQSLLSNRD